MASFHGWLPPLISHEPHQAHTMVDLVQWEPKESHRTWPPEDRSFPVPELKLVLEASIYYISKTEEQDNVNLVPNNEKLDDDFFEGLFIYEDWETLCSPEIATEDILQRFPYLASEAGRITWREMLHEGYEESRFELSNPEQMADKFSRFLSRMVKTGLGRYEVKLRIDKEIVIPKEELKSWHSWYDAKKKSDPRYEKDFTNAISRPRTREELLNEAVKPRGGLSLWSIDLFEEASEAEKESAECCIFCMDKFVIGSKACKLSACGHLFHRECLEKWLKESKECPVCRSQVLPDYKMPMKQEN